MASLSRSMLINLVFGLKGKGVDEATKQVKKLGKTFDGLNTRILAAAGSFAAFKIGGALVKFAGAAVEEARDLERNLNGLSTVFDGLTPQMRQFSIDAAQMGLSMNEAAKASTFIGSVLKQSGFSIQETADLTQQLVSLGTDLAITYGYDVQEALLGMTALFRGEYDPIEKFGVAMKQSEVNALLAERGLNKLTGSARRLAEQEIRVELLLQRSSDALGAYARQANTLFASQQRLRATFENLQAVVGFKLTPVFAELVSSLIPLVEQLIPAAVAIFETLIPVVKRITANKEELKNIVLGLAQTFLVIIKLAAFLTQALIENIGAIKNIVIAVGGLLVATKVWVVFRQAVDLAGAAILKIPPKIGFVVKALQALRVAIAMSGIGLIVAILSTAAGAILATTDGLSAEMASIQKEMDAFNLDEVTAESVGAVAGVEALNGALEDTASGAGAASDSVNDFFRSMADDANKLAARLQLEAAGASKGLIEKILGSGEDWYRVFAEVTREGVDSVRKVQAMFLQTAAGYDEAMQKWQEEFDAFQDFKKQALEARDALVEFTREFAVLPSIATEIGNFEQHAVDQLESIEEKLKEAFDNKQLLEESYNNLVQYARDEFNTLRQIERQRDQLLERRDAAAALIREVENSVRSSANLVQVFRNVEDAAAEVNIVEFAQRAVSAGGELREFRTALVTNFVEPIANAVSKADRLVSSYRSVVERTREFVENIKALRALGLDPVLFNQIIEAGVEAGGETARALVEGGADTVNEINALFAELNALGTELGENTAQVMYGQGEKFVDGIVKGLESQLVELESMAAELATSFTDTFEDVLIAGIDRAIAAAEAALSRMPQVPDMNFDFSGGRPGGGSGTVLGADGKPVVSILGTTFNQTQLQNLQPYKRSALQTGMTMDFSKSLSEYTSPTNRGSGLLGTTNRSVTYQTNFITTGANTKQTETAITRANAKTGTVISTQTPNKLPRRVD